jgi:hypothetical protein
MLPARSVFRHLFPIEDLQRAEGSIGAKQEDDEPG